MTNQVTDHGLLSPTMSRMREEEPDKILETVADKGYENAEDMLQCLENGIIPHVIMEDGKDGYELSISYEEAEADIHSIKPDELRKSLHAGLIPEVYADVISDIRVEEVRRKVRDEEEKSENVKYIYGTPEGMMERTKEGVR